MTRAILFVLVLLLAAPAEAQPYRRPFACDGCIANWFYFDHTGSEPGTEDWSCAISTYDGHRGTDFSLRGGLSAIDAGHDVVAAADGEVVRAQDGFFDRCTACGGEGCGTTFGFGYGNHVVVAHGDHHVVYAHLRNGSVRVALGDRVTCGQVLGQIGSSGCSTGAHLHFETRPRGGASTTAFDPFAGACSPTSPSQWTDQGAHRAIPGAACAVTCPAGSTPRWTCDDARTERRRCVDGVPAIEPCPWGCESAPAELEDTCAPPPDADADGATADVDCDDTDATIFPGATETCGDGVDQDCSGDDLLCPGDDGGPRPTLDAGTRDTPSLAGGCGCRITPHTSRAPFVCLVLATILATISLTLRRRRSKPSPRLDD